MENPVWHLYSDDDIEGGVSYAERSSSEGISIRCNLRESPEILGPFCGLYVLLDSSVDLPKVDLSNFETVQVSVDYKGDNDKLRFYIRGYSEGYSDPQNPIDTAKYMGVYIPVGETARPITIDMQAFTVADWWVNDNNVPRKYALGSLDNVVAFGIDIAYPAALGEHTLSLKKVTFKGHWVSAEDWYLGIILSWVGVIVVGGIVRLYQFRRLATTLRHQKDQYQQLSQVDSLTGLKNRHGLNTFMEQVLSEDDPSVWPVSFLFIDVDHFKPINDRYGHAAGDKVLQRVANAMNECCRGSDKVARWGGEEFLMIMPATGAPEASRVAERLRRAIESISHPEVGDRHITVSIGVSSVATSDDISLAIQKADEALYRAKEAGRNRVQRATVST